jgi:diadenylate cyclase
MEEEREVKEVQRTIVVAPPENKKVSEEEFLSVIKSIAPGTHIRTALDEALRAGRGGLIVIENEKIYPLLDGGFRVNCRFTPQKMVELAKMDGAIILSNDLKKIVYANVTLAPDSSIKTCETGTRHKAAERTAKQISGLAIAISERKHEIHVYYKNMRYHLKHTGDLLRKANEQIQLLEKHRESFDKYTEDLNKLEVKNNLNLACPVHVIQKGRLIQKIAKELKRYIVELGSEGTLLKTRLKEIVMGVEEETDFVIKDYTKLDVKKSRILLESLTYDEILENENIMRVLAYESLAQLSPVKGWRVLSKTSLQEAELAAIVKEMGNLNSIINCNPNLFTRIIGEDKARIFKDEIERIKSNF